MSQRVWLVFALAGAVAIVFAIFKARPLPYAAQPVAARPMAAARAAVPGLIESALARGLTPESLADLRQALLAADPRVAIEAIEAWLRTGQDGPTGQKFSVTSSGLSGAPTLRVFLMDLLGQIARSTGSGAADAVARATLEAKTSPEEWAIALRNVAWSEPNATGFLTTKMREMLAEPGWIAAPTSGLLQAFDVLVYAGDPSSLDQLSSFAQSDSAPLKRAALVTMDRLSERQPLAVMDYLNAHPAVLNERPFLRADYFSKVDLSQPAQQTALETYLNRADVSAPEKTKLLQELPAPATFVSDNLLTPIPAPTDDAAREKILAAVLREWEASNRFPELTPTIHQISSRY